MNLKNWDVHVVHRGVACSIGQVVECSEELARLAALSKFGVDEEEAAAAAAAGRAHFVIGPDDEFSVALAVS